MTRRAGGRRERRWVLPSAFAERAREFVAEGLPAAPPRPASTVMLVRDADAGLEVYVQARQTSMPFAGGMLAFPGGGAEPGDARTSLPHEADWARRLGASVDAARAFVHAAIRETQEESGVALMAEDLYPWAHWITPRFEPRRYDTWFFVAPMPDDATARDISGEASSAGWIRPAEALERGTQPDVAMLPPTRFVLEELAGFADVSSCLDVAAGRHVDVVMPSWIDEGDVVYAVLPGDDAYPGDDPGNRLE